MVFVLSRQLRVGFLAVVALWFIVGIVALPFEFEGVGEHPHADMLRMLPP